MGVPNSWMVSFMENPIYKWMTGGTPISGHLHIVDLLDNLKPSCRMPMIWRKQGTTTDEVANPGPLSVDVDPILGGRSVYMRIHISQKLAKPS